MATGTIFDSPWFTLERPAFERIAAQSDHWLTLALFGAAIVIVGIALLPASAKTTLFKAVVIGWIILP